MKNFGSRVFFLISSDRFRPVEHMETSKQTNKREKKRERELNEFGLVMDGRVVLVQSSMAICQLTHLILTTIIDIPANCIETGTKY